ncbi:MAG: class I SAM-dependent methyltransferase [Anaerolineae bacterium]|nr:class I SAM-dependent methyltransferase [Anaerolineae bacterium]
MLTPALLHWLQSDEAAPWLETLTATPPDDTELLTVLTRLRRRFAPEQAAALVEMARLRRRGRAKFGEQARHLFFSRELLEQASPPPVATHTAARFVGRPWVADLGCGLGADSLALAAAGPQVLALDRAELALRLTAVNARVGGLADRVHPVRGDITRPCWRLSAAWADPTRRREDTEATRVFDPEGWQPPLSVLLGLRTLTPDLGLKLAPGLPHDRIPPEAEAEWISLNGELKEAVLWLGGLARGAVRRATLLPAGVEIVAAGAVAAVRPPGAWLYEPDPAIIRAGAVGDVAVRLGLWQLDPTVAYLSGEAVPATPLVRGWPILDHVPFDLKALNRRLRQLDGEVVAVKKRGSPLDPEAFRRRLAGRPGGRPLLVVLTRVAGRPWVLIADAAIPDGPGMRPSPFPHLTRPG